MMIEHTTGRARTGRNRATGARTIYMPTIADRDEYLRVLAHELAHYLDPDFLRSADGEIIAEMAASRVVTLLGGTADMARSKAYCMAHAPRKTMSWKDLQTAADSRVKIISEYLTKHPKMW